MTENERRLVDEILARSSGCPDAEELEAYAYEGLETVAGERVRSHFAGCEACAAAVEFLSTEPEARAVPDDVVRRSEEWIAAASVDRPKRPASVPRWAWATLATAAALAIVAFLQLGDKAWVPESPQFRETDKDTVRSLVPESGLSRNDCRLRWSPGPEGSVYRVTVFTEDLRTLVSVEGLTSAEYIVPVRAIDAIDGDAFVWRVEVFPPEGDHRLSETFVTHLDR